MGVENIHGMENGGSYGHVGDNWKADLLQELVRKLQPAGILQRPRIQYSGR